MTGILTWIGKATKEVLPEEKKKGTLSLLAVGPISLFATLFVAMQRGGNLDLLVAAVIGLYLCFSRQKKALFYSLLLLAVSAAAKHALFLQSHLWQLGVETSIGLGFVISALSIDQIFSREGSLETRLQELERTFSALKQEAGQKEQEYIATHRALEEYVAQMKQELDLTHSELSSLRILNDVIRKSSLKKEGDEQKVLDLEKKVGDLLIEIGSLQSSYDESQLRAERDALLQELNAARVEREQTSLINETLVRMHASANRKAREIEAQNESLQERIETLIGNEEQMNLDLLEVREQLATVIEQRAASLDVEPTELREQLSEKDRMIAVFQERIRELSETQALYFQLKKQFAEKNQVLHETRQELFRTETALQAARMDQKWEEVELPFFESMLASEVSFLDDERRELESENAELSEIIGLLSKKSP